MSLFPKKVEYPFKRIVHPKMMSCAQLMGLSMEKKKKINRAHQLLIYPYYLFLVEEINSYRFILSTFRMKQFSFLG